MTAKLKVSALLFGLHLLLAALFAAHFGDWGLDYTGGRQLFYWGEFTGSSNLYSFFAPRVGDQASVLYTLADSSGRQQPILLETPTKEVGIRVATIYNFVRLPEGSSLFSRSFGNTILRLHPEARAARVSLIQQTMPSMTAFRDSMARPRWEMVEWRDYIRQDERSADSSR